MNMKMKKKSSMRVAVILLTLTLVTSCFVGSTFAKYFTTGSGSDSARVAKFGVMITANGATFAESYETDNRVAGVETHSVVSTDGKVVAPGTKGNMASMTFSGSPEVAVEVKYTASLVLNNWSYSDESYYCPIEIKVGEQTYKGTTYASADEFKQAVENAIAACSQNYKPGTEMSGISAPAVSWEWVFDGSNDEKDTYLGNQVGSDKAATISLTVNTTIAQID